MSGSRPAPSHHASTICEVSRTTRRSQYCWTSLYDLRISILWELRRSKRFVISRMIPTRPYLVVSDIYPPG
eukprot:9473127-Pyramimonas_sp.AAC.1